FEVYSRLYQLPVLLHYSLNLTDVPVIAILLKLLTLHERFRRADVLDVLRSPYIKLEDFSTEQLDMLERISLMYGVTGGRENWRKAIQKAAGDSPQDENHEDETEALLTAQEESDLSTGLE